MNARAAVACLLCLCAVLDVSHQIKISEFSVPDIVKAGEVIQLKCRYELSAGESKDNLYVKWWRQSFGSVDESGDRILLYQWIVSNGEHGIPVSHKNVPAYKVPVIIDSETLMLSNVTGAESGTYECEVSNVDHEARRHQQVVVYSEGDGPQLNVTEIEDGPDEDEQSDVFIGCSAYHVTPRPDIVLLINSVEIELDEQDKLVSGPDEEGFYDIAGNKSLPTSDVAAGAELRCDLVYPDTDFKHPPFSDSLTFYPEGFITSTEPSDEEADSVTPTQPDDSNRAEMLHTSWIRLLILGLLASLCI